MRTPELAPSLLVHRDTNRTVRAYADAGVTEPVLITDDGGRLTTALADGLPVIASTAGVLPEVLGIEVVVEATRAMEFGTRVILDALRGGRHVVSMNAEVDALLGHHLEAVAGHHGVTYTIADGDQPGVLLRMMHETHQLGLEVAVALDCNPNLDVHQSPEDSRPYGERDGTGVEMMTWFGDGTKLHIENGVTANLTGLVPPPIGTPGVGPGLATVAHDVRASGIPDGGVHCTLGGDFAGGVLVLAHSDAPDFDARYLRYNKLEDGPWYPLFRPYHLIHMEVSRILAQVLAGGPALGRRTPEPIATRVAMAKRELPLWASLAGIGGARATGWRRA